MKLFAIPLLAVLANSPQTEIEVVHPEVDCWVGERTYPVSEDSMVIWDTRNDQGPYLITHDRDLFMDGEEVVQDYNYLTYWFGNPGEPVQARHYLKSDEVSIILPVSPDVELNLEVAKSAIPEDVKCYLQKRFSKIEVLTDNGYEEVWAID